MDNNNNHQYVKLSRVPELVFNGLGISLTKTEVLALVRKAEMIVQANDVIYVSIEDFIEHLSKNQQLPDPKWEHANDARKDSAARYRATNMIIMQWLRAFLFGGTPSQTTAQLQSEFLQRLSETQETTQGTTQSLFTQEALKKHLNLFEQKASKEQKERQTQADKMVETSENLKAQAAQLLAQAEKWQKLPLPPKQTQGMVQEAERLNKQSEQLLEYVSKTAPKKQDLTDDEKDTEEE